jgi:hypothetical protein
MSLTITDPDMLAKLVAGEWVEFKDSTGKVMGRLHAELPGKLPAGFKLPFTEEELAEHRKERSGRPLAYIMRDLQARK